MIKRENEIKAIRKVQTMHVVADFTKLLTMEAYKETIESKLRGLDVAILVLNAGMATPGPF